MARTLFSGFCQLDPLVVNGSTSPIGEITTKGKTYAKEPYNYFNGKGVSELYIMRGVAGTAQHEKVPSSHSPAVLDVCDWLYAQAVAGKIGNSSQATLQALATQFKDGYIFLGVGTMVTDGKIWLPASINFELTKSNVVHEFKIWFALENYLNEFPYRDIYVFGPVPPEEIDLLADLNYRDLATRLAQETASRLQSRIDKLLDYDKYPPTNRQVLTYDVYDLINKPHTTPADWTIIMYGNPLNADEEINEAIKNCILSHSKYPETKWEDIIPDIFNPLEFFIVPHFDDVGLTNETLKGSTYSPIFQFLNGNKLALKYADFYDVSFINSSLQIVPHLYKSLKFSAIGKPKNNLGQITFGSVFPDYQIMPSEDSQMGGMSDLTQLFLAQSEDLFYSAEIADETNLLAAGVTKVMRKERLYVSKKIGKVKFTCITRFQFIKDGLITE